MAVDTPIGKSGHVKANNIFGETSELGSNALSGNELFKTESGDYRH